MVEAMTPQETIQAIEASITENRQYLSLYEAFERLQENRDFKTVIQNGYLKDEAVRLVHLKADPNMQTPERQEAILGGINGIGQLLSFFNAMRFNANQAKKAIEAGEEQIRDIESGGE
jgi:hypothetical protein